MGKEIMVGAPAPDFALPDENGAVVTLADFRGIGLVLYFYPRDDTPGCTTQAVDFTAALADFQAVNTAIIGVSADSSAKHAKFKAKHAIGITLLSDTEQRALTAYGVWVEKNMYGRKYMGIERTTFLIAPDGRIAHIWRKVKVKEHVAQVLEIARDN